MKETTSYQRNVSLTAAFLRTREDRKLLNALTNEKLTHVMRLVGLYTCWPYTFLVGVHNGSFFLIDSHPLGEALGGNGNAILVHIKDRSLQSCKMFVQWILKDLKRSGVNQEAAQSDSKHTAVGNFTEENNSLSLVLSSFE